MLDRLGGYTSAVCILCATFGCAIGLVMMVWILVAASFSYAVWAATALSLSVAITLLSALASILLCPARVSRFPAAPPEVARGTRGLPRMADLLLKDAPRADFRSK
jgi:multidrug efflux pump subunit AcrB